MKLSELNEKDQVLARKAMKAYGVEEKYLHNIRVNDGVVTVMTVGGAKVSWKEGQEVEKLEPIRVDGIIRKKMKPLTGAKKSA